MSSNTKGVEFGELFRRFRRAAPSRVTMGDIAKELDLSVSYISDIENGRRNPLRPQQIAGVCARFFGGEGTQELLAAAALARNGAVHLRSSDPEKVALLNALGRQLDSLDADAVRQIRLLVEGEGSDG